MLKFSHRNCNGWAIYDSEFIDGDEPQNIHVVETQIIEKEDGTAVSKPNSALETQCGCRHLVNRQRTYIFASKSENDLRDKLTELQNQGKRVCGQCVATFYADTTTEED